MNTRNMRLVRYFPPQDNRSFPVYEFFRGYSVNPTEYYVIAAGDLVEVRTVDVYPASAGIADEPTGSLGFLSFSFRPTPESWEEEKPRGPYLRCMHIGVDKGHRKQGVASELLRRFEERGREWGAQFLSVESIISDDHFDAMLVRRGFSFPHRADQAHKKLQ